MWVSVALSIDAQRAEALSEALLDQGALSVGIEDARAGTAQERPQYGEPGHLPDALWDESRVTALFASSADLLGRVAAAAMAAGIDDLPEIELDEVAEQDWVRLTQSQFEPIHISERLWIVPSWHMAQFAQGDSTIEHDAPTSSFPPEGRPPGHLAGSGCILQLDPGLAFGTGSHPTTRLCLEWLGDCVRPGDTILDYGCGSGILAIAAALFGAKQAVGVDIDENALTTARANAAGNGVVLTLLHSSAPLTEHFDIVVANILTNPLKLLAPLLAERMAPTGRLVLSGILETQAAEVIAAYAPHLALRVGATREGWCRLEGERIAC